MKSNAINYLKCLACLLVINTHITCLYPSNTSFLAMGGYFANCIFFFVSGYCLTNVDVVFHKWYFKRFIRVYTPYVLFLPWLFFCGKLNDWNVINIIMPFKEYHFIPSILFIYIVFYFFTKLHQKTRVKYELQICVLFFVALVYFVLFFDKKNGDVIEHFTLIETIFYIIPMLLGGLAKEGKMIHNNVVSCIVVLVSFMCYVYQSFNPFDGYMKLLQPCIGVSFSYGLSCFILSFEKKLKNCEIVNFIAMVTLECYIVQFISLNAFSKTNFPTNILYHVICSISVAYCLHKISNVIVNRMTKKK